jgi:uncharacterized membrane protein
MNTLQRLLQQHPLVFVHLLCALGALVVGAVVLARRKGTPSHRASGWLWVALMGTAVVTSGFIRDYRLPNIAGFTPIHLLTAYVAVALPRAVWQVRHGNVSAHRKSMRGIYIGGCIVAGLFTLLPSRFLGQLLWRQLSHIAA